MVRRVLTDPRVWGAVRLCQMDRYSVEQREAMRDAVRRKGSSLICCRWSSQKNGWIWCWQPY